jgi:hypothetical protein
VTTMERRLASYRHRLHEAEAQADPWSAIDQNSLALAGRFFGLRLENPHMREALLYLLADVCFGSRKKGRPPESNVEWTFARHFRLMQLYYVYFFRKRDTLKRLNRTEIAKRICEHPEFKNNNPEQVRQQIGVALKKVAAMEQRCLELDRSLRKEKRAKR